MKLDSLKSLYIEQLKDLYSAETQLVDALPKMEKAASTSSLKQAFHQHLEETKTHVQRIEDLFEELDSKPGGDKCEAMAGLIKEGDEMRKQRGDEEAIDAGLIAAAQRIEHYEIAGYGTVRTYAQLLGFDHAASVLQTTLGEESRADELLTDIARDINLEAIA